MKLKAIEKRPAWGRNLYKLEKARSNVKN